MLAGGATGMVGDPSGKSEERNLLDADQLAHNVQSIKRQLECKHEYDAPAADGGDESWDEATL